MTKKPFSRLPYPLILAIILVCLLASILPVSQAPADTIESTPVTGITREVNGNILSGVSITLDGTETVVSDPSGMYTIAATATGNHTLVAHKDGFRDRAQTINVEGPGEAYAVTCNFQGDTGLIPNAPSMRYTLMCINRWLYPPNPDTGLTMDTALNVINAWLYPASPTPTPEPTPTLTPEPTPTPTPEPTPIPPPVANFTAPTSVDRYNLTVTFTDLSTGERTKWEWDFNGDRTIDATYYQQTNPTYTYPAVNKTYAVTLTVTGPGGVSTHTRPLTVTGCGG